MAFVRIYVKRQIQLGRLDFNQQQMFKVGSVGVAAVKNRLAAGQGPEDGPAKPLTKSYARWKNRLLSGGGFRKTGAGSGRKGIRDLSLSGDMLRNLMVRTVSEKAARASTTGRSSIRTLRSKKGRLVGVENRLKAWVNQKIEPWLVLSPKNRQAVSEAAHRLFRENAKRLAFSKALGVKG